MNVRAALAIFSLSGLPAAASAQETITYTLNWIEVLANSSMPVANPNGVIDPGEGARVRVTTLVTPGIGAPATYTPPPAPGIGTIAGLGSIFFDLHQSGALGGMWSVLRNAGGPPGFPPGGTLNPDGSLSTTQAGQFILPPNPANPTNPWPGLWQGTWTPATYTPRNVTFTSAPAAAAGTSHSSILIQYGPDPQNDPQYIGKFVDGIFGNTGQIPVVPAPWSLATLTLASALARTRRAR